REIGAGRHRGTGTVPRVGGDDRASDGRRPPVRHGILRLFYDCGTAAKVAFCPDQRRRLTRESRTRRDYHARSAQLCAGVERVLGLPEATLERESRTRGSGRDSVWKTWIAAGLWLGIIATESTKYLSAQNTGSFLYGVLTRFLGEIDPDLFDIWHHFLRKAGHVVGYAILSWLLFRAWRATLPALSALRWALPWAAIAFVMSAIVAALDEWHQAYIPSR